jgi:hypothetical protein
MQPLLRPVLGLLALSMLAGCASTEVTSRQAYDGPVLPRPDRIVVQDFGATPGEVPADSALSAEPGMAAPQTAEDVELGRRLGSATAEKLAAKLRDMGLPAVRAAEAPSPRLGDVVIEGNFYAIDQGSTGKRVLLGFSSGAAELRTAVEVYQMTPAGLRHLAGGTTTSSGTKTPGLAAPLAVYAATANPLGLIVVGAMKVRGEGAGSSTVEGAAERTADEIAEQLKAGAQRQGWI